MPASAATVRPWVIAACCLAALAAIAAPVSAADGVTLRVTAGVGGLVKPGRWTAVVVEVERSRPDSSEASADLVVSWGEATARRRVFMAGPGTREYEMYVRASEAGSVIRVSLEGAGAFVDVPVSVLPHDTPVTLCVSGPDASPAPAASCAVTLAPHQLPLSARGYEVVDDVVSTADASAINGERRTALERWRALRRLDLSGDLALTPQATRPRVRRGLPGDSAAAVSIVAGVYAGLLILIGHVVVTRPVTLSRAALTFGVVLSGAAATSWWVGQSGPASHITVHHTTLLQQIPGTDSALLTLRGLAESPSHGELQLRVPFAEAMLEASTASERAPQSIDENGFAILQTDSGLGARHAFVVEGISTLSWLAVDDDGRSVRVANQSNNTLHDCRFADGMSTTAVGELAAGASVAAERRSDTVGPLFTCTTAAPAIALASPSTRAVRMTGTTTVVVYQPRTSAAAEVPND